MAKPTSRAFSKASTSPKPRKPATPATKPAPAAKPVKTAAKPAPAAKPVKSAAKPAAAAKPVKTAAKPAPAAKAKRAPRTDRPQPYADKRFAFFGEFAVWPTYHRSTPAGVAARLGARIVEDLDENVDVVVFGELRGTGRSEAKKLADKLVAKPGARLEVIDEATFRERVRIDLTGKRFAFIGGFDCSPAGLEDGLLARMVETAGGVVVTDIDQALDYLIVGNRRGPSKIALSNKADKLNEAGATIKKLEESSFLDLVRVDRPSTGGELDFAGFLSQLYASVDDGKLGRALDMLRKDRFKLYTRVDDAHLVGVVRSQTGSGSVYASWLTPEGKYGCAQPDLSECMGLQGAICKHLLVLVCGLARTGQIPLARALAWIQAASNKGPSDNDELCAETLIQYKGAEAGEVDWRPTETIPEDFYAL